MNTLFQHSRWVKMQGTLNKQKVFEKWAWRWEHFSSRTYTNTFFGRGYTPVKSNLRLMEVSLEFLRQRIFSQFEERAQSSLEGTCWKCPSYTRARSLGEIELSRYNNSLCTSVLRKPRHTSWLKFGSIFKPWDRFHIDRWKRSTRTSLTFATDLHH